MEFRILGPIEAQGAQGPVNLGGSKPRAVLAVLLLAANEPVSGAQLAMALWGEDSPVRAVRAVHVHVSRLRKALGDPALLSTTPAGYVLRVRRDELDVHRFERLLEEGRVALAAGRAVAAAQTLREALAIWRGPALADLALEPFACAEVERLDELRLSAIETRQRADLDAGRHEALVSELRGLVAEHPTRERLAEHLMLALYRCGRQAEALDVYGTARRALLDEIGVEPGPDLRALQAAVLGHEAGLLAAPVAGVRHASVRHGAEGPGSAMRGSMPPTKFVVPRCRPEQLSRVRQLAAIDPLARLLLVCAPVGYGKTTLVVQWINRVAPGRVAWVQLSSEDSAPPVFWGAVVSALALGRPAVGRRSLAALASPLVDLQEEVLVPLVADLCELDDPPALVLDDFHLVVDRATHATLAWFVDNAPHAMRTVIATRHDPHLPLGRLRARGDLAEVRAEQLVFDAAEVEQLLNGRLELELDDAELAALARRTEGWAAGLYLAALSLRDVADRAGFIAAFAGDDKVVFDYLAPEILGGLDDDRRRFLARTSILERFCASLCEAVAAPAPAVGELLIELERSNMFLVALDRRRRWFRYHHLFGDMLRAELERTEPQIIAQLHGRAAAWYYEHGELADCVAHHLAAGDHAGAAHRIAANWLALWHSDSWSVVVEWLAVLPEDEVAHVPGYLTTKAFVAGVSGERDELERLIALARRHDSGGPLPDGSSSTQGMIAMIEAVFVDRNVARARSAALRASQIETGSVHAMTIPYALGWTGFWSGAADADVREQLDRVVRMGRLDSAHARVAGALACHAYLDLLAGDLDAARLRVAQAETVAARTGDVAAAFQAYVACASGWLALADGRLDEAGERLREGLRQARRFDEPLHAANALRLLAECDAARGRDDLAATRLRRARGEVRSCADAGILGELVEASGRVVGERPAPERPGRPRAARLAGASEGRASEGRGHVAPMPRDAPAVDVADIDPHELGRALVDAGVAAGTLRSLRVRRDEVWPGAMSELLRVSLEWDGDGPSTLVAKQAAAGENTRATAARMRMYQREVLFYERFRARSPLRAPRCHHAAFDAADGRFLLLLEDHAADRRLDELEGCSIEDARAVVAAMGALHGEFQDVALGVDDELVPALGSAWYAASWVALLHATWEPASVLHADLTDGDTRALGAMLAGSAELVLARLSRAPRTLCHGDLRADNLLVAADGGLRAIDWQLLHRSRGASDLGYFMAVSLEPDLRRSHQAELVDLYVDAHGATDAAEVREDLRDAAVAAFMIPVIASAALELDNARSVEVCRTMYRRAAAFAADLDCVSLLAAR